MALVLAATAGTAWGQALERFERRLDEINRETRLSIRPEVPVQQRTYIDFGANLTFNYLYLTDQTTADHNIYQGYLDVWGRVSIDQVHDFYALVSARYRAFDDGESFNGDDEDWDGPEIRRAIYRFDSQEYMRAYEGKLVDWRIIFQGGRQLARWGNGVVLSELIDGIQVTGSAGRFELSIVAGVTPDDLVVDFDPSRPGFNDETNRGFFGGMLSYRMTPRHRLFVYGLVQRDFNSDEVLIFGPTTTRFSYDSHYIGVGAHGALGDRFQYGVEAVYEGGETLSSSFNNVTFVAVPQTADPIQAWAASARLDYLPGDTNRSRLTGEVLLASGDDDRLRSNTTFAGNQTGTTDRGFNAFGLLNTGLAFNPAFSNLAVLRVGGSTFPLPDNDVLSRWQIGADVLVFGKLDDSAPIDESTFTSSYLGTEIDLFTTWRIFSDLTLDIRYGIFLPGDAIAGRKVPRHFLFTGLTWSF